MSSKHENRNGGRYIGIQIEQATLYLDERGRKELETEQPQAFYELVRQEEEGDYHARITEAKDWEMMYQFSEQRANLIEWLHWERGRKVLELGAGCGSLTGVLLGQGLDVTCQEENANYCRLNALRHKNQRFRLIADSYENCQEILDEEYDYILCVGQLEKKPAEEYLESICRHLKENGVLILGTENKFGLKYWSGNPEPNTGSYFAGLENTSAREGTVLYTRKGLEKLFKKSGYKNWRFFYPYPDRRFPLNLYSDDYLPKKGELSNNIVNYEGDRLVLFDEQKVFDSVLEEEQFPLFSNSYLCLVGKADWGASGSSHSYIRYASDRSRKLAVRTVIDKMEAAGEEGTDPYGFRVYKFALYPEGRPHIGHIRESYLKLKEQYRHTDLKFNRCVLLEKKKDPGIELEYICGTSLEELVEQAILQHQTQKVFDILKKMVQYIKSVDEAVPFVWTEEFGQVFGRPQSLELLEGKACGRASDIDLVLANIILDGEGRWNVIDYEWTFFFPLPLDFMIYRTLFFLHQGNQEHEAFTTEKLLGFVGISNEEAAIYAQMEEAFQSYVTGGLVPYREMVNLLKRKFFHVAELKADYDRLAEQNEWLKGRGLWKLVRKLRQKLGGTPK